MNKIELTKRQLLLLSIATSYFFDRNCMEFTESYKDEVLELSKLVCQSYYDCDKQTV